MDKSRPEGQQPPGENSSPIRRDLRGMEPPQPMIEILTALERMESGGQLVALLPHRPIHLLPRLEAAGHHYTMEQRDSDTWELKVTKS